MFKDLNDLNRSGRQQSVERTQQKLYMNRYGHKSVAETFTGMNPEEIIVTIQEPHIIKGLRDMIKKWNWIDIIYDKQLSGPAYNPNIDPNDTKYSIINKLFEFTKLSKYINDLTSSGGQMTLSSYSLFRDSFKMPMTRSTKAALRLNPDQNIVVEIELFFTDRGWHIIPYKFIFMQQQGVVPHYAKYTVDGIDSNNIDQHYVQQYALRTIISMNYLGKSERYVIAIQPYEKDWSSEKRKDNDSD